MCAESQSAIQVEEGSDIYCIRLMRKSFETFTSHEIASEFIVYD